MTSEKIIVGEGTEYPLNGLLTLPDGEGPFPAAVMVHGSGASNMDEKVGKLTPFRDLAEGLAARGVASLRYDKRSFVHGRKMVRSGKAVTVKEETIDDAVLAAGLLKDDPRIDPKRVFIIGHSMGAMLAPRIDAEGADAAGLVMMAGTPHRMEDIVVRQLTQASAGGSFLGLVTKLENRIFSKKFDGLYEMSDEEAKKKKFAGSTTLYYFKEMGLKTASDYLLESDKPAFIMQGERDFQVFADDDFKAFKEQLGGRASTYFKLYPGLDHAFVEALYDDILKASKEFGTERHIGGEVLDDIAGFVLSGGRPEGQE